MPVAADTRLSHYRVLSLIGSGSAGEVYRARDSRLNRDVALKIISSGHADPETLRRFEVEAQSVAALNHPSVVTVYEAGREGDSLYIATELVDGRSLRQMLSTEGAMPLNVVLDLGSQIAEGLAAAHDQGIVHRDLKPENVMVTRDRRVKIVDFGIAKMAETENQSTLRTLGSNDTAPGLLLGTTAYMSPEQARGSRVSYPADQFALGLLLYEMATGHAPLRRETPLATLSAILTEDVPELPVGSPAFRWLVKRLLHREPDHRYGSMHDVVRELQNIRTRLTEQPGEETPAGIAPVLGRAFPRMRWLPWVALGLFCLVAGYLIGIRTKQGAPPRALFTPLISGSGLQVTPAFAPDGRSLAWSGEDPNGVLQIFAGGPRTAASIQLTDGPEAALSPFWSPDGSRIYYISAGALWSVGAAGGDSHLVLSGVVQAALARDGKTFAVVRPESTGALFRIHVGELTRLRPAGDAVLAPAFVRFAPDGRKLGAWVSRVDGKSEFRMIDPTTLESDVRLAGIASVGAAREFAWMPDSDRIIYADSTALSTGSHLQIVELANGRTEPLTSGTGTEFFPSVDRSGRRVAFAAAAVDYDIVRFGFDGEREELQATSRFDMSPSGVRNILAWISDRSGAPEILFRGPGESSERSLLSPDSFGEDRTAHITDLDLTADGTRLAFCRTGAEDEAIWISSVGGGTPVRLGKEPADAVQRGPSWSPDGNELVYFSIRNQEHILLRASPGTSQIPRIIARNAGTYPRWSPAGDRIATLGPGEGVTLLAPDGTGQTKAGTGQWLLHGWAANGKKLYGVRKRERTLEMVAIDADSGSEQTVAALGEFSAEFEAGSALGLRAFRGWSLAPDGRGVITSVLGIDSDLWLLER